MTPTLEFLLPGDPATRTGGYAYDRRIVAGLQALGWTVRVHRLAASFPFPDRAALDDAATCFAALPDGALVVVDGLAYGALPAIAAREAARLRLVALVHHPLARESGLDEPARVRLQASETEALRYARRVVVTGERTATDLAAWHVPRERIDVVPPGADRAPRARGSAPPAGDVATAVATSHEAVPTTLLCVATLTPRKGHDLLLDALAGVGTHAWRLVCVGSADRSPATAAELRAQATRLGLDAQVCWRGELADADLAAAFDAADVFVLAAHHEGYGMAVAEALAHGLPVIATRVGAVEHLVGDDAGVLVPPGDAAALRAALARVLDDAPYRRRLAAGAARARQRLPTWADACAAFDRVLRTVGSDGTLA